MYQEYIYQQARGSAQPHVYPTDIENLKMPVPPEDLITRYGQLVTSGNDKIGTNLQENQRLIELRDWLLPMLIERSSDGEINTNLFRRKRLMQIQITNCNNIDLAEIDLAESKLNIKFAPNGTGKSTIAKAIEFAAKKDSSALSSLLPFKYRDGKTDNPQPTVTGLEQVNNVLFFNDEYVNQFTFKEDELISNSFEIFIKNDAYTKAEEEINQLVQTIQQQFSSNADLEEFIANLKELSAAFKITTSGGLSKSSKGMKALSGNKLVHIPEGLEEFQPFIQGDKNVIWIDWQTKGHKEFSDISDICPFCSSDKSDKARKISKVTQEYDKNVVQNLKAIIDVVEKLGAYFSEETKENLNKITSLPNGIEKEHENFLVAIKGQIDNLVTKLERLKSLSGFHFREDEKVDDKLQELKIELTFFSHLKSEKTESQIETLNQSVDELAKKLVSFKEVSVSSEELQKGSLKNIKKKSMNF